MGFTKGTNEIVVDTYSLSKKIEKGKMKWIFNPPGTPHFGGVYEVMIREAKKALRRIVGNADINDEELIAVIVKVKSILNERPLLTS